jgi:hypothetical protein
MANLSLLVLAAGMGSRYGGLKQLDPMGPSGETLLDYSVFDALRSGFQRVVFLIRRDIEAEFREKVGQRYEGTVEVAYAFQQPDTLPVGFSTPEGRTKPWGTAHAIWCAREILTGPFAAINADDFYGHKSYEVIAKFLASNPKDSTRYGMAGYRLGNTLSEHGTVARGVCRVDETGRLQGIHEYTSLAKTHNGARDGGTEFTGEESVSMNFWGLTPAVFPQLETELVNFLSKSGTDLKTECYIPMALGNIVERGDATLDVLPTDAAWFGVTYRDDKPVVTEALQNLHARGTYPTPLWKA